MDRVDCFGDLDSLTHYQRTLFNEGDINWLQAECNALTRIFNRELSTSPREFIRQIWRVNDAIKWLTRRRTTQQDLIHTLRQQPVEITTTQ